MASYLRKVLTGEGGTPDPSGNHQSDSGDINWNPYKPPQESNKKTSPPKPQKKAPNPKPAPTKGNNPKTQIPPRVWVVKYLKDSIQGLVSQEAATGGAHSQMAPTRAESTDLEVEFDEAGVLKKPSLDERNHHVRNICLAVEQCCFHSLQLEEFHGMLPFWALIEHVARTSSSESERIQAACAKLSQHPTLNTPVGKARGFIRLALQTGQMESICSVLLLHPQLLRYFYRPDALMLCAEGTSILLSLLSSLETFLFGFDLDSPELNIAPEWPLLEELTLHLQGEFTPPPLVRKLSWTEDDIPAFESVIVDIERKLTTMTKPIEKVASKAIGLLSWELMGRGLGRRRRTRGDKRKGVFGVDLLEVITDVKRCQHAYLDPAIGIPRACAALLDTLEEVVEVTPDLFLKDADPIELSQLVQTLETTQRVPEQCNPHALAAALLLFLHKLPEPLLTYERYDAFVDCQHIEEDHARRRNIRLLIEELPWWHKPLLARLCRFLHLCVYPEETSPRSHGIAASNYRPKGVRRKGSPSPPRREGQKEKDSVDFRSAEGLALVFTPALLRSYEPISIASESERRAEIRAAGASKSVVRMLMSDYGYVLRGVMRDLDTRKKRLRSKVEMLNNLHMQFNISVCVEDPEHLQLLKVLWARLERSEELTIIALPTVKEEEELQECSNNPPTPFAAGLPESVIPVKSSPDSSPEKQTHKFEVPPALALQHSMSLPEGRYRAHSEGGSPWSSMTPLSLGSSSRLTQSMSYTSPNKKSPMKEINISWPSSPATARRVRLRSKSKSWHDTGAHRKSTDFTIGEGVIIEGEIKTEEKKAVLSSQKEPSITNISPLERIDSIDLSDTGLEELANCLHEDPFDGFSLSHKRWARMHIDPVTDFRHGLLTLRCIIYFIERFPEKASKMIASHTIDGNDKFVPLAGRLNKVLGDAVMVAPSSESERLRVAEISKQPFWRLFDNENAYHELFCMLMLIFEAITMLESSPDLNSLLLKARKIFTGVLATSPLNVDEMWQTWMDLAVESEKDKYYHHDYGKKAEEAEFRIRARTFSSPDDSSLPTDLPDQTTSGIGEDGLIWKKVGMFLTKLTHKSRIMDASSVLEIENILSTCHQGCNWELIFSLAGHGANLYTLLQLVEGVTPTLLLVKDTKGAVFGAFVDEAWAKNGDKYYGSASTFVFKLHRETSKAKAYRWSGKNRYFMLCNDDGMALGGGGHFALYLDNELYHGSSGYCTTFESPTLASPDAGEADPATALLGDAVASSFQCQEVEIWAVLPVSANPVSSRYRDRAHSFGSGSVGREY